jgi:hypothetical protein
MEFSVDALWQLPQTQLLTTYHEARRLYAERKFARDTERGRLQWLRAKTFVNTRGSVTERLNAVDASDDLARKGQQVREMTRGLDLLKSDIDLVFTTLRLRGVTLVTPGASDGVVGEASVALDTGQDDDRG